MTSSSADTKIQCSLDSKERPLHCHHEKTIVIDDRVAFVGGIDLTLESGDRYDTNDHPSAAIWALAGMTRARQIEGPAVSDVAEHFRMRWHEVTGETLAPSCRQRARRCGRITDRADGAREDL